MNIAATIRRIPDLLANLPGIDRLRRGGGDESSTFRTRKYWENRHQALRGSLRAVGHIQLTDEMNQRQYEVKRSRIATFIERRVGDARGLPSKTLLDAGCGTGALTGGYVEMGFEVTGVDFSRSAIRQARQRDIDARFGVSRLDRLALPTFDVITVIDVLLHIVDDAQWLNTLRSLTNHLKGGGVMIVLDRLSDTAERDGVRGRVASHCRLRAMAEYESALAELSMTVVDHERLTLEHEQATKDLFAVVRAG